MDMIKFGPAGLGGVKDAVKNLEEYSQLGLKACEISFTYGPYIKADQTKLIREASEKFNIKLSIHAPYWINLNSSEKKKIGESQKRILDSCKIGEMLGAYCIVFHPGYYGKMSKEQTYENIKNEILDIQEKIKKEKWKIKIAPETTGKLNVFGSIEEILNLVRDTGCFFCVDFAHIFARSNGKTSYKEAYEHFKNFNELHCHFSGIEYGDKGERNHKLTSESELKKLLSIFPKNKNITIINESPSPIKDSVKAIKIYNSL